MKYIFICMIMTAFCGIAAADSVHQFYCRTFSYEWNITVNRDEQFGGIAVSGMVLENGLPSSVGFGFPATLTQQSAGFTAKSLRVNNDGTSDFFSLNGSQGHISVKYLEDYTTQKLVGSVDEDFLCTPTDNEHGTVPFQHSGD